jgi:hypothetical protein
MGKRSSKKHQKVYKMKGCSQKKSKKNKKFFKYLGGSSSTPLAFTGKPVSMSQPPNLTPKLKGGYKSGHMMPANFTDYANPAVSSVPKGSINTNMGTYQKGGTCALCSMTGGSCGTQMPMKGGSCGCNSNTIMSGGAHTLEPAGLIGDPWTPKSSGWPGVDGISGNRNYLDYNSYKSDPQTALISVGANKPFLFGGKKKYSKTKKINRYKKMKQRGGVISNFISQDFLNLGRQAQFNLGSSYNAINGYAAPVNPMPWKDQLPNTPSLSALRAISL